MILTVEQLKNRIDYGEMPDDLIKERLSAIEEVIRRYTHNNFQNRAIRFIATAEGEKLTCKPSFIKVGDSIQISQSAANNGLYEVIGIEDDGLIVDRALFTETYNKVTKIEYPADVVQCAVDLFEWKKEYGGKVGIKSESETLSRHSQSTTYEDSATLFMGYPIGILKGLSLHKEMRC